MEHSVNVTAAARQLPMNVSHPIGESRTAANGLRTTVYNVGLAADARPPLIRDSWCKDQLEEPELCNPGGTGGASQPARAWRQRGGGTALPRRPPLSHPPGLPSTLRRCRECWRAGTRCTVGSPKKGGLCGIHHPRKTPKTAIEIWPHAARRRHSRPRRRQTVADLSRPPPPQKKSIYIYI